MGAGKAKLRQPQSSIRAEAVKKRETLHTKGIGLIDAALSYDVDKMSALLRSGEDVTQADSMGRTALHHAVLNGRIDLVQLLLEANADPNQADGRGWRPLHFAAQGYLIEIARLLLAHGAAVDPGDEHGNTPLFRAVFESRGRGDMITLLLAHGAERLRENVHGVSPLALARNIANFDVKRWLE